MGKEWGWKIKGDQKRQEKNGREGNRGTELCFLFLLRLLFKLLWKTVMSWVDPAAFEWQRLQTEILLGSDNHFEKQKTKRKLPVSLESISWDDLLPPCGSWVGLQRRASLACTPPVTPRIWNQGCVRASWGMSSPPVREQAGCCDPVLICSGPAVCWPRPWTFPAHDCRHVCSAAFPVPVHGHGLFLSNTVLSTLGDFCACGYLSKRIKNNSSVSGTLPKQCPYLASCWGVNTFLMMESNFHQCF